MNKIFLGLALIIFCQTASAQLFTKDKIQNNQNMDKPKYSWGYYLGFNSYDFNFDYYDNLPDIQTKQTFGFSVGLIGNMRINEHLDLRLEPGLFITRRDLHYSSTNFFGTDYNDNDLIREVKSTYIHVPLLLKVSTTRVNNIKPFVVGGFSAAINLSSNENNPDDNSNGQFRTKNNVFFYELGAGIDIYLPWFKFTPAIRGIFAINDELTRDSDPNSPWTGNIVSMKSRGFLISFTFQ